MPEQQREGWFAKTFRKLTIKVALKILAFFLIGAVAIIAATKLAALVKDLIGKNDRLEAEVVVLRASADSGLVRIRDLLVLDSANTDTISGLRISLGRATRTARIAIDSQRVLEGKIGEIIIVVGEEDGDTIATIILEGETVVIPVIVARALNQCKRTARDCDVAIFKVDSLETELLEAFGDSTFAGWVPTRIDSLMVIIDLQDQALAKQDTIMNAGSGFLGLNFLPDGGGQCGVYGGYRLTGGGGSSESVTEQFDDVQVTVFNSTEYSRWVIILGCGIGVDIF